MVGAKLGEKREWSWVFPHSVRQDPCSVLSVSFLSCPWSSSQSYHLPDNAEIKEGKPITSPLCCSFIKFWILSSICLLLLPFQSLQIPAFLFFPELVVLISAGMTGHGPAPSRWFQNDVFSFFFLRRKGRKKVSLDRKYTFFRNKWTVFTFPVVLWSAMLVGMG